MTFDPESGEEVALLNGVLNRCKMVSFCPLCLTTYETEEDHFEHILEGKRVVNKLKINGDIDLDSLDVKQGRFVTVVEGKGAFYQSETLEAAVAWAKGFLVGTDRVQEEWMMLSIVVYEQQWIKVKILDR